MSGWGYLILRIYHVLLAYYLPDFRVEFNVDMENVFTTALIEVQHRG